MELEVAQYRVQLIHGDLDLESDIQLGSGVHGAPLEDELQALEEQLEKTLRSKEAAEDKLRTLTARERTGWRESEDGKPRQEGYDSDQFTSASKTDPRSCADVDALHARNTAANRKCIQRV